MNFNSGVDVDRDLPRRVTRASLFFAAVLYLFLLGLSLQTWAVGYVLGAALGIYSFDVFRMGGRVFLRTEQMKEENPIPFWKKGVVVGLFLAKLPIWGGTMYAVAVDPGMHLVGFIGGIATPQFVMFSKVISRWLFVELDEADNANEPTKFSVKHLSE